MIRLLLLQIILLSTLSASANEIDKLKTDSDVIHFIRKVYHGGLERNLVSGQPHLSNRDSMCICNCKFSEIDSVCNIVFSKARPRLWYKVDFDNDHKTDLVAHIYYEDYAHSSSFLHRYIIAIRSIEADKYDVKFIENGKVGLGEFVTPVRIKRKNYLLYYNSRYSFETESFLTGPDTLTYKFGGFVEYDPNPETLRIKELSFTHEDSPGGDSAFVIEINMTSGSIKLTQHDMPIVNWHKPISINYGKLERHMLDSLSNLISYMGFSSMKDQYSYSATHGCYNHTRIVYYDGREKKVGDYWCAGTFGLMRLYQFFFDLQKNHFSDQKKILFKVENHAADIYDSDDLQVDFRIKNLSSAPIYIPPNFIVSPPDEGVDIEYQVYYCDEDTIEIAAEYEQTYHKRLIKYETLGADVSFSFKDNIHGYFFKKPGAYKIKFKCAKYLDPGNNSPDSIYVNVHKEFFEQHLILKKHTDKKIKPIYNPYNDEIYFSSTCTFLECELRSKDRNIHKSSGGYSKDQK